MRTLICNCGFAVGMTHEEVIDDSNGEVAVVEVYHRLDDNSEIGLCPKCGEPLKVVKVK